MRWNLLVLCLGLSVPALAASKGDCEAAAKSLNKLMPEKERMDDATLKQWVEGCTKDMSEPQAKCIGKAKKLADFEKCN